MAITNVIHWRRPSGSGRGNFERSTPLASVAGKDSAQVEFKDGVLRIRLPRPTSTKYRRRRQTAGAGLSVGSGGG